MSIMVAEVYEAFISAGVKAEKAKAAAVALSRESKTESQEVRQEIKANFKGDILEIKGDVQELLSFNLQKIEKRIKKILKLTVAVMTLGLFTTSVFAADWGISGQVRVNWDVSKTVKNDTDSDDTANGIAAGNSRTPNGVFIDEGYSWIEFDLAGENESAYILYYPGGGAEYGGTATAESGEWAATATINTRNYVAFDSGARAGYNNQGNRSGDHHVKLAHSSGFSVLLGRDTVLDGWRRGRANLLLGDTGGTGHIQRDAPSANSDALDARAQYSRYWYSKF